MIKTAFQVYVARDHAELVAQWHHFIAKRALGPVHMTDSTPLVYVNDNRWLIDCPNCGSGVCVNPRRQELPAMCFECGQSREVTWPPDWEDAELVLDQRPPQNRNWCPLKETTDDLRGENARSGVPVPPRPQQREL